MINQKNIRILFDSFWTLVARQKNKESRKHHHVNK
jgi:hypothetical protein